MAVMLEIEMQRPERTAEHIEICRKIVAEDEDWKGTAGRTDSAKRVLAVVKGRPFAKHFGDSSHDLRTVWFCPSRRLKPWSTGDALCSPEAIKQMERNV